jgi:hypothetical protein
MTDTNPSHDPVPNPSPTWRIFAIPGILALVGYVAFYNIDARLRSTKGPWEVTFGRDAHGTPTLEIHQAHLGISNVTVRLVGETTTADLEVPIRVRFDVPKAPLPFGTTAFDDLMYLPGTVVLHCFGHEIQMLPRAFFLNRKEFAWSNAPIYEARPGDKLPTLDPPKKYLKGPKPN